MAQNPELQERYSSLVLAKQRKLIADGKDVAQDILETQLEKAIEWIKNPKNQEKLFEAGIVVFKLVLAKI